MHKLKLKTKIKNSQQIETKYILYRVILKYTVKNSLLIDPTLFLMSELELPG